ncbi:MAG: anti-sigma F factor [Clostridiales bacterium]|nr:anti-sigma F factor [Clostridiales bacterium]
MEKRDEKKGEKMSLLLESRSQNEAFARVVVGAFMARLDPTLEEVEDVKTAVSEAVTNCIIHGYHNRPGEISIEASIEGRTLTVKIEDHGVGIEDIEQAREPLFTTRADSGRSGMGFCFMEAFMDQVDVESELWKGTTVTMKKELKEQRRNGVG